MDFSSAIILGIVEGITEYLPVSSTGHLLLTAKLLSLDETKATNAYLIVIQGGAILAVLTLYWHRFWQMAQGIFANDKKGQKLIFNLLIAFLPAAVFGLLFDEKIEQYLFGLTPVAMAWLVGGVVMLWLPQKFFDKKNKTSVDNIKWQIALLVGLGQCLAFLPGVSRSLATILTGLLVGLPLAVAVEFSFLLGMITLSAASGYKMLQQGADIITANGWAAVMTGLIVSYLTAMIAVKWMVEYLQTHNLKLFGWWRIILAVIVIIWLIE